MSNEAAQQQATDEHAENKVYSIIQGVWIDEADAVQIRDSFEWCSAEYAAANFYWSVPRDSWFTTEEASGYWVCDHCEGMQRSSELMLSTEDHGVICDTCSSQHFTYSVIQEVYILDRYAVMLADQGSFVSLEYARANCHWHAASGGWYEDSDNVPGSILHYGANIFGVLGASPPRSDEFLMGVELEMEPSNDEESTEEQEQIVEALGGARGESHICKSDGSLDDGGVELVTLPGSLAWHKEKFGWDAKLAAVRDIAKSGKGTNHCGMHVHVNRRAVTQLQIGKLLVWINSPRNSDLVTDIAQRSENRFCEISAKKVTDGTKSNSRYEAINLQNADTIEFRIFRGNLRLERVFKNIEFVHALCAYVKDCSLQRLNDSYAFVSFVQNSRKRYPYLAAFLIEKGWLTQRTQTLDTLAIEEA